MTKTYQSFLREYTEEPSQESQEQEQTNSEIQKLEIRKAAIIDEIEELPDESPEKIKKREELLGVETEIEKLKLIAIKGETAKINQKITANNKDIKDLQQTRQELEKQESGTTEETDTTDGTDKKKSEGFTKAYNNTSKVVGNEDNEDDEDSEESRQTQGKTIGLQNSKHKSLADFLSEGVPIQSHFDLDYAGKRGKDGNIHIRIGNGAGSKYKRVPIKVEDNVVDAYDILKYVNNNKEEIIVKKEDLGKKVFLSKQLEKEPMIVVNNDIELKLIEADAKENPKETVLVISLAEKGRSIGRRSFQRLVKKISNKFNSMTERSPLV